MAYKLKQFQVKAKITNSDQSRKSQIQYKNKSWANTDPWAHQRWDQVPRRSKHPLLIGHTRREPIVLIHHLYNARAPEVNLRSGVNISDVGVKTLRILSH